MRAPMILKKAAYQLKCFDCSFYKQHNEDLLVEESITCWDLFAHFLNFGQFEMRPNRCVHP